MNVGEINKGAVALLLVLVLGAGGYLWYSMLYKPAVAARETAVAAEAQAQSGLQAAQQELEAAQKRLDDSKKASAKSDDSVARLAKARTAIPTKQLIDDAAIVLVELADRSGVQTAFKAGGETSDQSAAPAEGTLQGAVPVDLEFEAAGSYAEMMQFMSLVENTVEAKDGKLFTRGRLFNVVKLEIGAPEEEESQGGDQFGMTSGQEEPAGEELNPGPNDILFTVVVRMYTSSTDNAESVGDATADPAASATADPAAAGAAGVPGEAGAPAADAATGGAPAGSDPAAAGATAATGAPAGDPSAGATSAPAATGAPAGGGI